MNPEPLDKKMDDKAMKELDCLTCLQNETPCENLISLYKLDQLVQGLDITRHALRCSKNGRYYELTPKGER